MRHIQIELPDQSELVSLLQEIKLKVLKEAQPSNDSLFPKRDYLTRSELAHQYRISLPTVHKHIRCGLPSIKIGKRRLFSASAVAKYFEEKNKLSLK